MFGDDLFQFGDADHLACGFVGDEAVHFVKADDHVAVLLFEDGLVNARDALARFAVRGDDDDARVVADPQADHVQPVFHLTLLDAAARLPDQQVERTAAEEELVRDAVDVLPAEIPGVELDLDAVLGGVRQAQTVNVNFDAVRGGFVFLRGFACLALQGFEQGGLADVAFADQHQFGFVERFGVFSRLRR